MLADTPALIFKAITHVMWQQNGEALLLDLCLIT